MIKDLGDERFKVRDAASEELKRIGTPAESALRRAMTETTSAESRRRIFDVLRVVGMPERIEALIQLLGQPEADGAKLTETRKAIAELVVIGPAAVPQLVKAICGGHHTAGAYSANALDKIGKAAVEVVRTEWPKLSEQDRWKLMRFRGQVDSTEALRFAMDSLESPHNDVRRQAIEYMGQHKEGKARAALIKKLDTEFPELRWVCVDALTEIGGDEAINAFIKLLDPKSWAAKGQGLSPPKGRSPPWWPDGRPKVIAALNRLKATQSAPALLRVLQEKGQGLAYLGSFIIPLLEEFRYQEAIPELRHVLATGRRQLARCIHPEETHGQAARALWAMGDRLGRPFLIQYLLDREWGTGSVVFDA